MGDEDGVDAMRKGWMIQRPGTRTTQARAPVPHPLYRCTFCHTATPVFVDLSHACWNRTCYMMSDSVPGRLRMSLCRILMGTNETSNWNTARVILIFPSLTLPNTSPPARARVPPARTCRQDMVNMGV